MDVRALVDAVTFLRDKVRGGKLAKRYRNLIAGVNSQNADQIRSELDGLRKALAEADISVRGVADLELLTDFGVADLVGPIAIARVNEIFAQNPANPSAIAPKLEEQAARVDEIDSRIQTLVSALGPMLETKTTEHAPGEGEGLLWLRFDHAVSVDTMQQLPGAIEKWNTILHHFSRVVPGTDSTAKLVQIRKQSPLIVEVVASVGLLGPITWGVNRVVHSMGNIIDLRKKAEELKQMKVRTGILESLAEHIKEDRNAVASEAANGVQTEFKCDNEARNAVELALKEVIAFIESGGEIDVDVPPVRPTEEDPLPDPPLELDNVRLRDLIRGVQRELPTLPPVSGDGEPPKSA